MTRRATLRASDADREQVAERLRHAAAEGRLLAEEFEERLGTALSARTYGELDAIVSDLPSASVGPSRRSPQPFRLGHAVALAFALPLALMLIGALGFAAGGHSHAYHHYNVGLGGGAPLIWLVLIAIGWRLLVHRRGGVR
jgi:hypothetical protein